MHLNCCMSSCLIERPQQKSRVWCNVAVHRTRYPRKAKPELEYNPLIWWRNPPSDPNESKGAIFIYGVSGSCQFHKKRCPWKLLKVGTWNDLLYIIQYLSIKRCIIRSVSGKHHQNNLAKMFPSKTPRWLVAIGAAQWPLTLHAPVSESYAAKSPAAPHCGNPIFMVDSKDMCPMIYHCW